MKIIIIGLLAYATLTIVAVYGFALLLPSIDIGNNWDFPRQDYE